MEKRSIDDIMSGVYYDDDERDYKQNNKNRNNQNNNNQNNKKNNKKRNQLKELYIGKSNNKVYDRDHILNLLVKKECLLEMISDLKKIKKSNENGYSYITTAIRDIIFASALPEAIDKVFGKDKKYVDNRFGVTKKDLDYLMDEILYFCNSRNDKLIHKYGSEAVKSMIEAYTNILYKLNKKKMKKFKDINISDKMVKRLVVLTAGKTIQNSIYQLLNYLYKVADDRSFSFSKKNTIKLFKACYGKKSMPEVAKCLLLERVPKFELSKSSEDLWMTLDEIMRDTLEELSKDEIEKILKEFVTTRRRQEQNNKIPRRLGNRLSIHRDDYKKLTTVFDKLEKKDFSVIGYFR